MWMTISPGCNEDCFVFPLQQNLIGQKFLEISLCYYMVSIFDHIDET